MRLLSGASTWHRRQLKETKPEALTLPMRNTLLGCVIKELKQRLDDIREGTDTCQGLIRSNWLKNDAGKWSWSYLRWEPGSKSLTVDTAKRVSFSRCDSRSPGQHQQARQNKRDYLQISSIAASDSGHEG